MSAERKNIPLTDCKPRMVYRIFSRNLDIGVFNPKDNGFIGIREKFGHEYLFTEYHWDTGPPFGTVSPLEEIGELPADIELSEDLGAVDQKSRRPIAFDKSNGWYYTDTGESDSNIRAVSVNNEKLFEYLKSLK